MSKGKLRELLKDYQRMKPLITLKEYIMIIIATIPYAIAVNWILVPHTIVGGGLTGLCEIIYFATDAFVPIWLSSFVCNLALLIAAFFTVGWRYCVRTLWGVLWYTIWLKVIEIPAEPVISDPFMAVILGGLFMGSFLGIVFLNNGSTGGVDIVAMIVNKYKHLPMGRVLMACDIVIILCAYFLPEIKELPFGQGLEKILFGLCYTFMAGTAVDWVLNRTRQSVQFFIFSEKYEEIAEAIMTQVPRGVTFLDAQGGYSKSPTKVITTIARQHESATIFRLVHAIDPNAFISQSQVRGVFGQGFESIKEKA
ncbi:MAG: YitT family protein [Paludibacteraceae bacterium]|nr:YitT family protein [Paludibacteraceae bacterium]